MPSSQSPVLDHQGQFGLLVQEHTGARNGRTQFGYLSSEPPTNINPNQNDASAARRGGAAAPRVALAPAPAPAPMMTHGHPETGGLPLGLTNRNWDLRLLHLSHKMPWVWGKYPSHGEMIPMPLQEFGKSLQTEATTIMWSNPFVKRRPDHRYYYDMAFYELPDGDWIAWWQSTGRCQGFTNINLLDNLEEQSPVGVGSMDVAFAVQPPAQAITHGKSQRRRTSQPLLLNATGHQEQDRSITTSGQQEQDHSTTTVTREQLEEVTQSKDVGESEFDKIAREWIRTPKDEQARYLQNLKRSALSRDLRLYDHLLYIQQKKDWFSTLSDQEKVRLKADKPAFEASFQAWKQSNAEKQTPELQHPQPRRSANNTINTTSRILPAASSSPAQYKVAAKAGHKRQRRQEALVDEKRRKVEHSSQASSARNTPTTTAPSKALSARAAYSPPLPPYQPLGYEQGTGHYPAGGHPQNFTHNGYPSQNQGFVQQQAPGYQQHTGSFHISPPQDFSYYPRPPVQQQRHGIERRALNPLSTIPQQTSNLPNAYFPPEYSSKMNDHGKRVRKPATAAQDAEEEQHQGSKKPRHELYKRPVVSQPLSKGARVRHEMIQRINQDRRASGVRSQTMTPQRPVADPTDYAGDHVNTAPAPEAPVASSPAVVGLGIYHAPPSSLQQQIPMASSPRASGSGDLYPPTQMHQQAPIAGSPGVGSNIETPFLVNESSEPEVDHDEKSNKSGANDQGNSVTDDDKVPASYANVDNPADIIFGGKQVDVDPRFIYHLPPARTQETAAQAPPPEAPVTPTTPNPAPEAPPAPSPFVLPPGVKPDTPAALDAQDAWFHANFWFDPQARKVVARPIPALAPAPPTTPPPNRTNHGVLIRNLDRSPTPPPAPQRSPSPFTKLSKQWEEEDAAYKAIEEAQEAELMDNIWDLPALPDTPGMQWYVNQTEKRGAMETDQVAKEHVAELERKKRAKEEHGEKKENEGKKEDEE